MLEPSLERFNVERSAKIDAILGDASAGWARLETHLNIVNPVRNPEFMAVHPHYEYLFGDVPAYRGFVAQANGLD